MYGGDQIVIIRGMMVPGGSYATVNIQLFAKGSWWQAVDWKSSYFLTESVNARTVEMDIIWLNSLRFFLFF